MEFIKAFERENTLIGQYGKNNFFTAWAMGLYLDTADLAQHLHQRDGDGMD